MVVGLIIRSGLFVGVIYYTRSAGVWGNSEETEKLYNNIKNELSPYATKLKKQLPFDIPALPQTGEICFLAKHYYNGGVKKTFNFIEMLPCYTGQIIKKANNKIDEFLQSTKTSH